ncbi:MAG: preprotein translocase subunit SecE [Phycisphaerales bacterium JB063]
MGLSVYKPGQGYWTRVLTAVGVATIVLAGIGWFVRRIMPTLGWISRDNLLYAQAGFAAVVLLITGVLLWFVLNKPRFADFMIATENEMKKVNWPSKKATVGLTWVVIAGTLLLAGLLFLFDILFAGFFSQIGILKT